MKALMKEPLQEVLEAEMSQFLGAGPSERTDERKGEPVLKNETLA
jgi:putative transposase